MEKEQEDSFDGQSKDDLLSVKLKTNLNEDTNKCVLFVQNIVSQEQAHFNEAQNDSSSQTIISHSDKDSKDRDNSVHIEPITVVKTIAKVKKVKNKKFVWRPLYVEPIYQVKLKKHNAFMLYCYLQIEDIYSDFDGFEEGQLEDLSVSCQVIEKIERNLGEQGGFTVHVHSMVSSGIQDFQFLLNHFSNLLPPKYVQLYQYLQIYQQLCIEQSKHLKDVHQKIQARIICEDEVTQAIEQFHIYLSQYVKNNYEDTDFLEYCVIELNPETEDIRLKSITLSESFLCLLGYEESPTTMNGLPSLIYLTELLGINRLNKVIGQLELLIGLKENFIIEQDLLTADNIKLSVSLKLGYIECINRPSWMSPWDLFATTIQIFVGMNQLEALLKIRAERASQKRQIKIGFEQQMQQEIFIEKFYPNMYCQNNDQTAQQDTSV